MDIRLNDHNPRFIKDDKFKKLVQSIKDDPEFLDARPIVVKNGIIYGGNMRYRALQELGIPLKDEWIKDVSNWTDEQIRKFIVIDNLAYGENDWDMLSEQYDKEELEDWGMDVDKNWGEEFKGENSEIDTDELGKDLDLECPKCHFKFKNPNGT
jgi:ParB-like chromosome segregation protein Spo0J